MKAADWKKSADSVKHRIVGMEKGTGPPLPPRILIQLDRLSNVQFSQLTRKQLKDQVDQLKQALIEEFAKLKPVSERPQVTAANDSTSATNHPRPIDPSSKTATSTHHKDIPKTNSSADKKPIPIKPSNEKRDPGKEVNNKTAAKSSVPSKPSYADLLKMAESVRKEPSPVRASSREEFANSVEDNRKNGSHGSKSITSNHRPSSPLRSRSNEVPRREPDRDKKMNVPKPDSRDRKSSVRSNQDSRNHQESNQGVIGILEVINRERQILRTPNVLQTIVPLKKNHRMGKILLNQRKEESERRVKRRKKKKSWKGKGKK